MKCYNVVGLLSAINSAPEIEIRSVSVMEREHDGARALSLKIKVRVCFFC